MTTTSPDPKDRLSAAKAAKAKAESEIAAAEKAARAAASEEILAIEMELRRKLKSYAETVEAQNADILAIKKKIAELKIFIGEEAPEAEPPTSKVKVATPASKTPVSKTPDPDEYLDMDNWPWLRIVVISVCVIIGCAVYLFS